MIINCKDIRTREVIRLKALPKLEGYVAFIQVGDNQASNVYVRNKLLLCEELCIVTEHIKLGDDTTERTLQNMIYCLNVDKACMGIMVQLPLPDNIDELAVINAISPNKDIDGFTNINKGKLMIGDKSGIVPCTPQAILTILDNMGVGLMGRNVVIVGRSNIVGKPLANLLINEGATITVCNSNTLINDIVYLMDGCDIFISAIGKPNYWNSEKLGLCNIEDTIAIDVGINRDSDNKLCGDIDKELYDRFKAITPVPGGVGVLTVLEVIRNIYKCALGTDII